jgi:hypothetical protein
MDKLIRDGKVAVLYSPGFGAGWYTWNQEHPDCLFNPEIVEAVLAGKNELAQQIAEEKYEGFYGGGARDLEVEWMPSGTVFEIEEYDGKESIHIIGDREYLTA